MEVTSTATLNAEAKVPFTTRVKARLSKIGKGSVEFFKTIGTGLWNMFKAPFIAAKNAFLNMVVNFRILFNQKNSADHVYYFMNKETNYIGFVLLNVLAMVGLGVTVFLTLTSLNVLYVVLASVALTIMSLIEYKEA